MIKVDISYVSSSLLKEKKRERGGGGRAKALATQQSERAGAVDCVILV